MRHRGHRAGLLLAASAIAWASTADAGETIAYSYDSLGRLVRVERSGDVNAGVSAVYSYDTADNRTNVTVSGAGTPSVAGGSFETPEVGTGYVYAPAGGPASFTRHTGVAGNGSAWGFAAAPDGDQVAFVQRDVASTISLPVAGLTPGASYAASFWIAIRPGYLTNPVTVSFNGAPLGTFVPDTAAFAPRTSAAFTATASSGTLVFSGSDSSFDLNTGLDRVTVAAAGAPAP
jgi:hypothetical protein